MLRKPATSTAAKLVANRVNAKRIPRGRRRQMWASAATGPPRLAEAGDEVRSAYVGSIHDTMVTLGEDPGELTRFLARLILQRQPAGPTEMMLVDDIALLEWDRQRVE